jgi:hypothetical protein
MIHGMDRLPSCSSSDPSVEVDIRHHLFLQSREMSSSAIPIVWTFQESEKQY